jgi:hypothetical protein
MRSIEVRHPRENDVVGRRFTVAGFGTGFEGTVLWRVLDDDAAPLAEGPVEDVGSNGVIDHFGHDARLPGSASARGGARRQPGPAHRPGREPPRADPPRSAAVNPRRSPKEFP